MFESREIWVRLGVPCGLVVALAACAPKPARPPSVEELTHDRVALDGVVLKCNGDLDLARTNPACAAARIAIDRLAEERDAAEAAKREAAFERRREELRLAEEQQRLEREEAAKVDAYSLPVVPIDPEAVPTVSKSPAAASPPTAMSGPGIGGGQRPVGAVPVIAATRRPLLGQIVR